MSGKSERAQLVARLDAAAGQGRQIRFWWRDDDAEDATPALDRLLALRRRHHVPLALAVVPERATSALAARLAPEPRVAVLQHGWAHLNHARAGEKKIELGGGRPLAEVTRELAAGRGRLSSLFSAQSLPVLVPPWNRIDDAVRERLADTGFAALSTFGQGGDDALRQINTHVDLFHWRPERRALAPAEALASLAAEVERRLAGSTEPIGLLTHHRVHDAEAWATLEAMLAVLGSHPAALWPEIDALFGLAQG